MFDDNRKKKEESERIKAIRAEQRLAAEKEEDEEDEEEDEEDSKPRKKKSKKPKEEVRNWNLGVSKNTLSYSPCLIVCIIKLTCIKCCWGSSPKL